MLVSICQGNSYRMSRAYNAIMHIFSILQVFTICETACNLFKKLVCRANSFECPKLRRPMSLESADDLPCAPDNECNSSSEIFDLSSTISRDSLINARDFSRLRDDNIEVYMDRCGTMILPTSARTVPFKWWPVQDALCRVVQNHNYVVGQVSYEAIQHMYRYVEAVPTSAQFKRKYDAAILDVVCYFNRAVQHEYKERVKRRMTPDQKRKVWAYNLPQIAHIRGKVELHTHIINSHENDVDAVQVTDLPKSDFRIEPSAWPPLRKDDYVVRPSVTELCRQIAIHKAKLELHVAGPDRTEIGKDIGVINSLLRKCRGVTGSTTVFSRQITVDAFDLHDMITPMTVLFYQMYRARNVSDSLVAVVGFVDRISAREGHVHMRCAARWAASYYAANKHLVEEQVTILCEYFKTVSEPKVELHTDVYSAVTAVTSGISKATHLRAFVYLSAFSFMSISAANSGVFPSFNDFSKEALALSNMMDITKTTTGTTVMLLSQAIGLCTDFVRNFMNRGFKALWMSDSRMLNEMLEEGRRVLVDASAMDLTWEYGPLAKLGASMEDYIKRYDANLPRFSVYKIGSNFAGVGFSSETNLAIQWAEITKVASGIKSALRSYQAMMASVAFRKAPFCIELFGGSSIGKSSVTNYLAKYFLLREGMPDESKYIYTVNPNQQYLDGYHPWQSVFVLDDVATVREKYMPEGDPQVLGIIQYVNNVALLTNQADLSRKATTPFMSKYVIVTTNKKELNAHMYANNSPAILRRVKWFVTLGIAQGYDDGNGALDSVAAQQWYANNPRGHWPPFWVYHVQQCRIKNTGPGNTRLDHEYVNVSGQAGWDKDHFVMWLRDTVKEHWDGQEVIVDQISSSGNMKMCQECHMVSGMPHHVSCSKAGTSVQCLNTDVAVVCGTVAFSVVVAALCSKACNYIYIAVLHLWMNVVTFYIRVQYSMRQIVAFCADVGYTVAAFRATLDGTSNGIVSFIALLIRLAILVFFPYAVSLPFNMVVSLMPSRRMFAGYVSYRKYVEAIVLAGGVAFIGAYVANKMSRDKTKKVEKHVEQADFSAYESVPTYGAARNVPYTSNGPNALVSAWSSHSKCSSGDSHDGVFSSISRNVFRALISCETIKSRTVGFVYKRGVILVNAHAIARFFGKPFDIVLAYHEQEVELGAPVPQKPNHYTMARVDPCCVLVDNARDLAMIYIPQETRKGIMDYVVMPGNSNYGQDPHLLGRDLCGRMTLAGLQYQHASDNVHYADGELSIDMVKALHYTSSMEMRAGDSGSLFLQHSGKLSAGKKGFLAVAGIHAGCFRSEGGSVGFTTAFDRAILDSMADKLNEHRERAAKEIFAAAGESASLVRQSCTMHSDVVVEDVIFDLEKGSQGGVLMSTHYKAPITWYDYNPANSFVSVAVYGAVIGDSRKSQGTKSSYYPTPWSKLLSDTGHHIVLGDLSNRFLPAKVPRNELWQVQRHTLEDLCAGDWRGIPTLVLDAAVTGYYMDVVSRVKHNDNNKSWELIQPLSYEEVINGRDGIFEGIVKKTGGGFGYNGAKSKHVVVLDTPIEGLCKTGQHWTFDDDVMQSVREADTMLRRGEDPRFVYACHLKDEVRDAKKIAEHKMRMICGASIPCIILMRKYLLTLIIFMQQNPIATECAVGMNVESKQWTDLAHFLRAKGGDDRYIAGDYKSFDKNQTFPISLAVARVFWLLIMHAQVHYGGKFSSEDLTAVRTLLIGLCHPTYDHFGTLLRVLGTNPSGNTVTTQRNCVANSLYTRSAFVVAAEIYTGAPYHVSMQWFDKAVAQSNYGDDIVAAISAMFPWFNHDVIHAILGTWGIVFTHADKTTECGRPYDRFDDITFVKRSWVYDDEIGGYLAPLDPSSIVKSLHWYHQGHHLSYDQQLVALIRDAAENSLCYGRDRYSRVCELLSNIAQCAGFSEDDLREATSFTMYDDFVDRYKANSMHNHKFRSQTHEMLAPALRSDIPDKWRGLMQLHSQVWGNYPLNSAECNITRPKCGSFNPYGNGQPVFSIMDVLLRKGPLFHASFSCVFLPILDAISNDDYTRVEVGSTDEPFDHVYFVIDGERFAYLDSSEFNVRIGLVNALERHNYMGFVRYGTDILAHHGIYSTTNNLVFPGLAARTIVNVCGWQVGRRSAMMPGEGYRTRVTKFECECRDYNIIIGVFSGDVPRVVKRKRSPTPETPDDTRDGDSGPMNIPENLHP